jgi:catechol 2,3-dioxygenase-like lactoylglutathione lyase family enzyme
MSRVQLALRVADLEASIAFYTKLFGAEPAKRRPGYANFAITEPPVKLVLLEGQPGEPTRMDHLGVEVETTGEVTAAAGRLATEGLDAATEQDSACCYAVQDKVWTTGPAASPGRSTSSKLTPTSSTRRPTPPAAPRRGQRNRRSLRSLLRLRLLLTQHAPAGTFPARQRESAGRAFRRSRTTVAD